LISAAFNLDRTLGAGSGTGVRYPPGGM